MDREPEQRRDLEHAQPGPNPMGGERFTVIEVHYSTSPTTGKRIAVARSTYTNQPFAAGKRDIY